MTVYEFGQFHLPSSWLVALAGGGIHEFAYGLRGLYGVFRFLHLLGMAGFVGTILLFEVKRLGFFPAASLQLARQPVVTLMNISFGITLLTGLCLFLYDPIGVGMHSMFLPKLLLIVWGLIHAYWVERLPPIRNRPRWKKASAALALAIWFLVIAGSTWNHVERPYNPADLHRLEPEM